MTTPTALAAARAAFERGDHEAAVRLVTQLLDERPGDDAAHELRARAELALGRTAEAERDAQDAVRLDPEEIRYRELLAQVLAAGGAHHDAATEYRRLARNDPRQRDWALAEAGERLSAAEADEAVEAARRAVRLDRADPSAQVALARALVRTGDAAGAMAASAAALQLAPDDPAAREAAADASWLTGNAAGALAAFRDLAARSPGAERTRLTDKARRLYRSRAGALGRFVAAWPWLFGLALRNGWLHIR
ncbi:MAG TPA: tetratricopeptide repeat protein [Candidatus Limnocylindria bacterium]|jgi:tetratricopeptide (TPR) repeat protein